MGYYWRLGNIAPIPDVVSIDEVIEKAFAVLGNDGKIQAAKDHACAEYSQPY